MTLLARKNSYPDPNDCMQARNPRFPTQDRVIKSGKGDAMFGANRQLWTDRVHRSCLPFCVPSGLTYEVRRIQKTCCMRSGLFLNQPNLLLCLSCRLGDIWHIQLTDKPSRNLLSDCKTRYIFPRCVSGTPICSLCSVLQHSDILLRGMRLMDAHLPLYVLALLAAVGLIDG